MFDSFDDYYARLEHVSEKIMRRMSHDTARMLDEGISPAQFFLMRLVARQEAITVSQIADLLGVTLSAVTSLSDRLETGGWLTRERHPQDRRLVVMKLTEAGRQKFAELETKRLAVVRRYMEHLSEDDRLQFLHLFEKLHAAMEQPHE